MSVTSPSRKTSLTKRRSSEEESYVSSSSLSQESESLESIIKKKLGIKKGKKKSDLFQKQFVFRNYTGEGHGQSIYSAQFNQTLINRKIFATVGANQVSTFECLEEGYSITPIRVFADPDANEIFYSLAWSYNVTDRSPLIAVSGLRGLIRIFSFEEMRNVVNLRGHAQAVNELKFHPKLPHLLLSASKDHSVRLWNIKSKNLIAIFGGVEGHRDEALSADFDLLGDNIISSGMDHTLMMWDLTELKPRIALSDKFNPVTEGRQFPTEIQHYPKFNTRTIHRNYVDCVKYFGDAILSKSCENEIVCWKPQTQPPHQNDEAVRSNEIVNFHTFSFEDGELWFVRFGMDHHQRLLAVGSQTGSVYVWNLDVEDPMNIQRAVLFHPKCKSPIRQATFSRDGDILILVCDDASIWRWDKVKMSNGYEMEHEIN